MSVTWSTTDKSSNITLSNNNLTAYNATASWSSIRTTPRNNSNLYLYWEVKIDTLSSNGIFIGIGNELQSLSDFLGSNNSYGIGIYSYDGKTYFANTWNNYARAFLTNDVIGVALNLNDKKIKFSINGTWYPELNIGGISGTWYPMVTLRNGGKIIANFSNGFAYNYPTDKTYVPYGYSLKYLIKQNTNYYTIKPTNYDSTTNHNFTPLTLTGGSTPNKTDIDTFGFDDLSVLGNSMTVGGDTIMPISKLGNNFDIKLYKPS